MADPLVFLTPADLAILRLLVEDRKNLRKEVKRSPEDKTNQSPDVYVAKLPCGLGLAGMSPTSNLPGYVECCIFTSVVDDKGRKIIAPVKTEDIYDENDQLIEEGINVRVGVYNIHEQSIPVGAGYIQIFRTKFGIWLAERWIGSTVQAVTTTTTRVQAVEQKRCIGACRYVWSAASSSWSLQTDECSISTTSTTTKEPCSGSCTWVWDDGSMAWDAIINLCGDDCQCYPPSEVGTHGQTEQTSCIDPLPASTTTTDCLCPQTTSTPDPASTSTTSSSTTTTQEDPPCKCQAPTWCGDEDGECTWTDCVANEYNQNPPQCSSTSSTSTSETTTTTNPDCECISGIYHCSTTTGDPNTSTTTGDPNTSTTSPPPNCDGCDWVCCDGDWMLANDNCTPCNRPCSPPEEPPGENCNAHTDCGPPSNPNPPPPIPCTGSCLFKCDCGGEWRRVSGRCSGGQCCGCPAPSKKCDCHDEATVECTPCDPTPDPDPNGSTTPDPASTTTPNPCTSTSSTSSTTTTTDPCSGRCKWKWDWIDEQLGIGEWTSLSDPCPSECPCCVPYYEGVNDCEVTYTYCSHEQCTSTTSTTSSTTTTACQPPGECRWIGEFNEFGFAWGFYDSDCCSGYDCCAPSSGGLIGELRSVVCLGTGQCPSTTTKEPCSGCSYRCNRGVWTLAYNHCGGICMCQDAPTSRCMNGASVFYPCDK